MMEELIGRLLNKRYRVGDPLGEGGMGSVFEGYDVVLKRKVAIKVLHQHRAHRPDFRERFLQEAQAIAQMDNHPGIVKVYDCGEDGSRLYIVMEFIPGQNLRQMLETLKASQQWISLSEAIQLVQQVCLAVDHANRQGVVHRDIKPNNVMLKPEKSNGLDYRPVLTDLGLAKLLGGGLETEAGVSLGTPAYVSPEQALGEAIDPRSDVYSLGVLLYELAVGQLPYQIQTMPEAIRCHSKALPPQRPRTINEALPELVERVILKALARAPDDRYEDAAALAKALTAVEPRVSSATVPSTAVEGPGNLVTLLDQSRSEPRGRPLAGQYPTPPGLEQDYLEIEAPDGSKDTVPIKRGGMTFGRLVGNDLVLEDPKVSGHHARLEFDGHTYQVVDLNSTNGTYLAEDKLSPQQPVVWRPDQVLRLGRTYLQLRRVRPTGTEGLMTRADGTAVDRSEIQTSVEERVAVFMEPKELSVAPGSSTTASLIILNQGEVVDHFQVTVEGIPAEWLLEALPAVHLMPDQQQTVTLAIQPPRTPQSRAGSYPVAVRVTSQDAPEQVAEVTATLTVAACHRFHSELRPQRIQAGTLGRLSVENQGNLPETFSLTWQDRADELIFEPGQAQLTVAAGETATAEFRTNPRQRRWFGTTRMHSILAQVSPAEGETQEPNAEVISKALIPLWIPPVLLFFCVALVLAVAVGFCNGEPPPPKPTPTDFIRQEETEEIPPTVGTVILDKIQGRSIPTPTRDVIKEVEIIATPTRK